MQKILTALIESLCRALIRLARIEARMAQKRRKIDEAIQAHEKASVQTTPRQTPKERDEELIRTLRDVARNW